MKLYHYCSIETFKKIMQSKTLIFSDIMKSNDSEEIISLWNKYCDYIYRTSSNSYASTSVKYFKDSQLKENIYLALCFSEKYDDLYMWKSYADGGIAIGFDLESIENWIKNIHYFNDLKQYPNKVVCAKFKNIEYYDVNKIDEYIAKKCKNIELVTDKLNDVFFEAPFTKNSFFEMEEEVRILITIFKSNENSNKLEYIPEEENPPVTIKLESNCNRNFDNVITATIPFPSKMIKSITLAPNCKLNLEDIQQILYVNDFNNNIEIKKSKVSYR